MAPERSLIPPEDNTSTSFQTAANVVGVIPPQIHDILTNNSDALTSSKIDDNTSGLSYLINNTNSNVISVWEHSTQTLNEELIPPSRGICVNLIHPEHDTTSNVDNNNNKLLVTCLGPNNNTSTNNHRRGEGNNNSLRHLYAASSTSGVLSVWVLDNTTKNTTSTNDGFVECDASVRLALKDNEVLTSLTSMNNTSGGNSDTWLLASTNYGRLYKIYKTSRPLTLSAKLIKKKLIPSDISNGGQQVDVEEEEETGLVRGLYNYFTTPSKKKVESSYGEDEVMDEGLPGSPYNSSLDDENIVALVTLPSATDGSSIVGTESSNKSPPRTPAHSPQKQRRISTPNSSSSARAVSVSSSLVLKEWKISLLAGPDISEGGGGKNKEGYMTRTQLFPRHENDGTLDLSGLSQDNLEGYTTTEMLAAPQLAKDNNSLLMIIRLSKENDVDATRAYVVRIGLSSNGGRSKSPHIIDRRL